MIPADHQGVIEKLQRLEGEMTDALVNGALWNANMRAWGNRILLWRDFLSLEVLAALIAGAPQEKNQEEDTRVDTMGGPTDSRTAATNETKEATAPLTGWQPIETAPSRRKVFVTWVNSMGKRRTAMASYWPEGELDMADDVPDWQVTNEGTNLDAGWWEESEGNDDAMFRLIEKMTHWMPLPASPDATPGAPDPQEPSR